MANIAIVLAGGIGSRIGFSLPKQFIKVLGKPIMIYTLEVYEKNPVIDEIVLVCVKSHIDIAQEYCEKYSINKIRAIISGGDSFLASCINGMKYMKNYSSNDDIVIVTSADRPFTSHAEIDDSILCCQKYGSGVAARKCALCMFDVSDDRLHSHKYLRESLVQTGTPWAFKFGLLMDALERYENGELPKCEAYPPAIYVAAGHEVYFSKLYPSNIKITEKTDIALMEQILKERECV